MNKLHKVGTFLVALMIVALGTTAGAVDITGTWEGKETCKCFNNVDGKFTRKLKDEVMGITQSGTDLNIFIFDELFNGNVINDPTNLPRVDNRLEVRNGDDMP